MNTDFILQLAYPLLVGYIIGVNLAAIGAIGYGIYWSVKKLRNRKPKHLIH